MMANIAGQGVFAAEWMPMTGTDGGAAIAHRLLAFVASERVGWAMGTPALSAEFDTGWAKATSAARSCAGLEMDIAVVTAAIRVVTARSTGAATDLTTGAAENLIFGAGDFVAACAAHAAVGTQRGLVNVAGEGVSWAHRMRTDRAGAGASDTHCLI